MVIAPLPARSLVRPPTCRLGVATPSPVVSDRPPEGPTSPNPVEIPTEPEPREAVGVRMTTPPLTPPSPLRTVTLPPLAKVVVEVVGVEGEVMLPADSVKGAPPLVVGKDEEVLVPGEMEIPPAFPPSLAPVERVRSPVPPTTAEPVVSVALPVTAAPASKVPEPAALAAAGEVEKTWAAASL